MGTQINRTAIANENIDLFIDKFEKKIRELAMWR